MGSTGLQPRTVADAESVAGWLRSYLDVLGADEAELSRGTGLSPRYLEAILCGRLLPGARDLDTIAAALRIDPMPLQWKLRWELALRCTWQTERSISLSSEGQRSAPLAMFCAMASGMRSSHRQANSCSSDGDPP